jgi:hypothetical protein
MIDAVEMFGFFDGGDVGGLFEHANQALVAGCAGAVDAGVDVGDVIAEGTEAKAGFDVADRGCKRFGVFVTGAQNVEGKSLRALRANTRQLLQFVNQTGHRFSKLRHRKLSDGAIGRL